MFRQTNQFVVACLAILLIVGLVTGAVREGYVIGWLIVIALMAFLIPKSWKPILRVAGTLLAVTLLICVMRGFFTSIYMDNDGHPALAMLLLSFVAYLVWKHRHPRVREKQRLGGAERTPVMPYQETVE